ncbi:MAG: esterase/lipase family protein [Candidatus Thorarchaeota archaeon]
MIEIDTSNGTALLQDPMPNPGPPILFVHGFNSSSEIWLDTEDEEGFASIAANHGFDPWLLDLSDPNLGDIRKLATEDLHKSIRMVYQKKKQKLRLVCHSMGGLLARIVTTENLLPDVPGFLSAPHLREIAMLATPNHGYVSGETFSDLIRAVESILDLFASDSLKKSLARPFFQMLPGTLLSRLNKDPPLCPFLSWKNGVALEDLVIPTDSAMFGKIETISIPRFEQCLFHASHMEGREHWERMSNQARDLLKKKRTFNLHYLEYPPIYRHPEVAEWLFSKSS